VMLVHGFQWLIECFVAGAATIPLSDDQEGSSLSSDGNIQKELLLYLVPIQAEASAMRAAQRHRFLLGGDLIVVFALVYGQNMIVRPAKNVQEMLSQRKELPHKFSVKAEFPVARDGRLLRVSCFYSTRFAGFRMWCTAVLFHVLCRIAIFDGCINVV
jgi:hypothetical protein